ncbi:hypothetical protein KP509_22G020700 [Ceratopteris richardii]|uniref:RING-type E3 ubiquitin transferase n=1 Tax=Ceratopteris richardii TaxID=49495 RepID=A0A8T2S363_CERRI|nr:hypothetical protein KP509_22G020700 [Ceratopteris richardii]
MSSYGLTLLLGISCLCGMSILVLVYCKFLRMYLTVFDKGIGSSDLVSERPERSYIISVVPAVDEEAAADSNGRGLEADVLESITPIQYSQLLAMAASSSDVTDVLARDCCICLEAFEAQEMVQRVPSCGHSFHHACIYPWLLLHGSCPLCRSAILP